AEPNSTKELSTHSVEKSLPAPNPANRPPRDKDEKIEHKHRFFSQLKTAHFRYNLLFVLGFLTLSEFPILDFHKLFHRSCEFLPVEAFKPCQAVFRGI